MRRPLRKHGFPRKPDPCHPRLIHSRRQQKLASRIHPRKLFPDPHNGYELRSLSFDFVSNCPAISCVLDEDFGERAVEVVGADADSGRGGGEVDVVEDEDLVEVDGDLGEGFFNFCLAQIKKTFGIANGSLIFHLSKRFSPSSSFYKRSL